MHDPRGGPRTCARKGKYKSGLNTAIVDPNSVPLKTDDPRSRSRLDFQLRRIQRLHQQASENGIALDPGACARELDDAIAWATKP